MPDPIAEALTPARRVKALRLRLGLTQTGMTERFGIPRRTIQEWEAGRRIPPEYVLRMLEALAGQPAPPSP